MALANGKIYLPYTLQTWVGMVMNGGLPEMRAHSSTATSRNSLETVQLENAVVTLPRVKRYTYYSGINKKDTKDVERIKTFSDFGRVDWSAEKWKPVVEAAATSIRRGMPLDQACVRGDKEDVVRYLANVDACRRGDVDVYRLSSMIKWRVRMDLEQAATAVITSFVGAGRLKDAETLLAELGGVLAVSDMSCPQDWPAMTSRNTLAQAAKQTFANLADKVMFWSERSGREGLKTPRSYADLVPLLLRMRSRRKWERCLYIPQWMFDAADMKPPPHHNEFLQTHVANLREKGREVESILGYKFPEAARDEDTIVLSKHGFRVLQKKIFHVYPFWDPSICLRRDIRTLEDAVLYASSWIEDVLRETEDVAEIAHWFFAFQRRLQLKVVSDEAWSTFLAKGESSTVFQNNTSVRSSFEDALRKLANKPPEETMGSQDQTISMIDRTCRLMKRYVDVYGGSNRENLVFKKGVSGGSGRGPVDEYNALCDILRELKIRAKNQGVEKVPGPVYKFLAKDIMSWNSAWEDDAFAGGKVHGWEDWLKEKP